MNLFNLTPNKLSLPTLEQALPGRSEPIEIHSAHAVLKTPIAPEYPAGTDRFLVGMGCFWGVERLFWEQTGVYTTAVGYSGGFTPNPYYEEVCSGLTGHNEVVLVIFWPHQLSYSALLRLFWEHHNPTQGMRQGNDRGTQYRSAIYTFSAEQQAQAEKTRAAYQVQLDARGLPSISTEIQPAGPFYFAEEYHQQYLAKNPGGYCNLQSLDKSGLPPLEPRK